MVDSRLLQYLLFNAFTKAFIRTSNDCAIHCCWGNISHGYNKKYLCKSDKNRNQHNVWVSRYVLILKQKVLPVKKHLFFSSEPQDEAMKIF